MTKLLGPKDVFSDAEFQEILSPIVEPATASDFALIGDLLERLGFDNLRPTTGQKLSVLLSSFLIQSMRLQGRKEGRGEAMIIGWPHDARYWSRRSRVGYKAAEQLRGALLANGWITHKVGATINLYERNGNCNGYLIADFVPDLAKGVAFKSSDLLYAISTSSQAHKLANFDVDNRVRSLWAKWKKHPLRFQNQSMFAAARRFNNDELTRGGRLYGPWTTMKKVDRLRCKIDYQPVAEVDVSGMHLTLLASISCEILFKSRFKDPYECGWDDREQVKAIINETIGAGTPRHFQLGNLCRKIGLDQESFTHIRKNFITPKFKCLQILKKGTNG